MRNWKKVAHRVAARLDRQFDSARLALGATDGVDRIVRIHPFRGYGTAQTLHVMGRVLRQPRIALAADHGTPWSNLVDSFRRLASEEVGAATIIAELDGISVKSETDAEGYFHIAIPLTPGNVAPSSRTHAVRLRIDASPSLETVIAEVMVPSPSAHFGIISDIDDTIVETNATGLVRMARTVFTNNARGRIVAAGMPDFYRALERGISGSDFNPFFYVSSSPWNFFDLLDQFLGLNGIPSGPLMLQDYGIDETKLIHSPHDDHKLTQIEEILKTYPDMPFVLVGDSGQRDPEIYRTVATRFPGRVRAIYIRDVTTAARDAVVRAIAEELSSSGVCIALISKTEEAIVHARSIGLLCDNPAK